jgi:uncharacterized protein YyaL (SSP411 family)
MEAELARVRARLFRHRSLRPQPARDDKVLADWNGLAISGLARAARATENAMARRGAMSAYRFVAESMSKNGRLGHSAMSSTQVAGVATDYANMIRASLDLFLLEPDKQYLDQAQAWFSAANRHHFDSESAAYRLAADDSPRLIADTLSVLDEAAPAATGTMAANAAALFALTGDVGYRRHAERILAAFAGRASADVVGSAGLQSAYDTLLRGRLAIVSGPAGETEELLGVALAQADPALLATALAPDAIPPGHPAAGKRPTKGASALYLCDATRCLPELSSAQEAAAALAATRRGLA